MPEGKVGWLQGRDEPLPKMAVARIALNITQTDLGELIGLTQATISDYERGMRIPRGRRPTIVALLKERAIGRHDLELHEAQLIDSLTPETLQDFYSEPVD